jgi:hypothetical protein
MIDSVSPNEATDAAVATALIAAPAWVPALSEINEVLTTVTLLLGVVLGVGRLWLFVRRRLEHRDL